MIVTIRGILKEKNPGSIIIEAAGLGYKCLISVNTFDRLPPVNEEVELLTYFQVAENGQWLYAFYEQTEKTLFTMLISVSGIGPRTAIALLSAVTPDEFRRRLIAGEVKMLTALPGIGPKTARRIIVELKDKFVRLAEEDLPVEEVILLPAVREANDALITLGFKQSDISRVLNKMDDESKSLSSEEIIKKALSGLH